MRRFLYPIFLVAVAMHFPMLSKADESHPPDDADSPMWIERAMCLDSEELVVLCDKMKNLEFDTIPDDHPQEKWDWITAFPIVMYRQQTELEEEIQEGLSSLWSLTPEEDWRIANLMSTQTQLTQYLNYTIARVAGQSVRFIASIRHDTTSDTLQVVPVHGKSELSWFRMEHKHLDKNGVVTLIVWVSPLPAVQKSVTQEEMTIEKQVIHEDELIVSQMHGTILGDLTFEVSDLPGNLRDGLTAMERKIDILHSAPHMSDGMRRATYGDAVDHPVAVMEGVIDTYRVHHPAENQTVIEVVVTNAQIVDWKLPTDVLILEFESDEEDQKQDREETSRLILERCVPLE